VRVLVTGSRDWDNGVLINRLLAGICEDYDLNYPPDEHGNTLPDPSKITVVHGAAKTGADFWADQWAIANCDMRLVERHPADWSRGRGAGLARNHKMIALGADLCLAFVMPCRSTACTRKAPHGSHGTMHCAAHARMAGIETRYYGMDLTAGGLPIG
jgi:hypothetical protein